MSYTLHCGDCLDIMQAMSGDTYDAVFCDPPYGISFMNRRWDHGVPSVDVWAEVYRIAKPGAYLLAFGGTRTWHRLAVNIEDAEWELFDTIMYMYGSGFPKSHNISIAIDKAAGATREVVGSKVGLPGYRNGDTGPHGNAYGNGLSNGNAKSTITAPATPAAAAWDGYGSALKPSYEPVLCFRKPVDGTYAHNAIAHGCGGLNIDACRVPMTDGATMARNNKPGDNGWKNSSGGANHAALHGEPAGRWPANLIHDSSDEVLALLPYTETHGRTGSNKNGNPLAKAYDGGWKTTGGTHGSNSGSAARFFYTAKASKSERNAGIDGSNPHPTVKPLALTEYLARLILPPSAYRDTARILIPYAGVGSEAIGAMRAGWQNIDGIELDAEYCEINRRRFAHWQTEARSVQPALLDV